MTSLKRTDDEFVEEASAICKFCGDHLDANKRPEVHVLLLGHKLNQFLNNFDTVNIHSTMEHISITPLHFL